jgi:hypothetical protein
VNVLQATYLKYIKGLSNTTFRGSQIKGIGEGRRKQANRRCLGNFRLAMRTGEPEDVVCMQRREIKQRSGKLKEREQ